MLYLFDRVVCAVLLLSIPELGVLPGCVLAGDDVEHMPVLLDSITVLAFALFFFQLFYAKRL
tara:strand:- start:45 stop:230 length:186 start_codon:yes stop_codon:yes gene_type:complete